MYFLNNTKINKQFLNIFFNIYIFKHKKTVYIYSEKPNKFISPTRSQLKLSETDLHLENNNLTLTELNNPHTTTNSTVPKLPEIINKSEINKIN